MFIDNSTSWETHPTYERLELKISKEKDYLRHGGDEKIRAGLLPKTAKPTVTDQS